MKKLFYLFLGFITLNPILPLMSQNLIKNSSITGVCYAGNKVNRFYIAPPDEFSRKAGSKG